MKKTILLILAALPCIAFTQLKLRPGFIVKNYRDTVKGYIKPFAEKQLNDQVFFTQKSESEPLALTTADITSFGYNDGNTFTKITYAHPTTFITNTRFAKMLVDGYYRLYTFWQKERNFFIITTYEDSTYLLYDDSFSGTSGIIDESGNYRNQLLFFSISCDDLKRHLENIEYNESEMAKYVDKLNKCVSPSEENAIVYKKEKSYLSVYAYAGAMILSKGYEYTGRIIARFTIPSIDKNMSVNVGINFMDHHREYLTSDPYTNHIVKRTTYKSVFSVPFTLQYDFTQGRIRPYINAGLSLAYLTDYGKQPFSTVNNFDEKKFGVGFILAGGIEGFVTKRLIIKADFQYELFLHYPTLGIGYYFK